MEPTALTTEEQKALESVRTRVSDITQTIDSLNKSVRSTHPLPPWASIHTSTQILTKNMDDLVNHLARHAQLFNRVVVYPSTNYPGRTQENILGQLLRKKLEPPVEKLIEDGLVTEAAEASKHQDEEVLWEWARGWLGGRIREFLTTEMEDNFTADERARGLDTINTGLKRKLDEDDDDDDEDEDDDEEEDQKMPDVPVGLAVTSVHVTAEGPVEFGLGQTAKNPNGSVRTEDSILAFATSGAILQATGPQIRK